MQLLTVYMTDIMDSINYGPYNMAMQSLSELTIITLIRYMIYSVRIGNHQADHQLFNSEPLGDILTFLTLIFIIFRNTVTHRSTVISLPVSLSKT